LRQRLMKYLRR